MTAIIMKEENQTSHLTFEEVIMSLAHLSGIERDKTIWNAALNWASQNVYLEVVDEFTGEITEAKVESMDLMDEIYQVSKSSILSGWQ
jgi:hypothetical protein